MVYPHSVGRSPRSPVRAHQLWGVPVEITDETAVAAAAASAVVIL